MTTSQKMFSAETEKFLREHFQRKDVNHNGYLDIDELEQCLLILGFRNPSEKELIYLKKHMDTSGNGRLEVEELIQNIGFIYHHLDKGEELMEAFAKYDLNGDGLIRLPEMLEVLMKEGLTEPESRKLLRKLCDKYDLEMNVKFSYLEFTEFALEDDHKFLQKLPLKKC